MGGTLLGLVMAIGMLEMTKLPEQRQHERDRAQLKLHCKAMRDGLAPPPGSGDSDGRRRLEDSCRQIGLLPVR